MATEPVSSDKMAAPPASSVKIAFIPEHPAVTDATPESLAIMDATLESSAVMDATPVFPVVMNAAHEDIKAVPWHLRLASSLEDTPLTSVLVAGIPRPVLYRPPASMLSSLPVPTPSIPEVVPLFSVLPVTAMAILCVWDRHCSPVHESTPEFTPVPEPSLITYELCIGSNIRKIGNVTNPSIVISHEGDRVVLKTLSPILNTEISFKLGEEFDETTADDRQVKSIVTLEGESLVHVQRWDGKETKIVREIKDGKMINTLTFEGVQAVRTYEKE
ncbi:Fatty acid-binding protein, brain [Anabarilius grahami]|uniref:Fatty acid-binding protein, brain n=1 Tax=Anabarilius grahami TaxID=495550 RepID=A0A3N0Y9C2_ANAGA|nr:Fatty acid-binding protein, brain [Anabarilius grahami]